MIISLPPPNENAGGEPPSADGNTVLLRQEVWGPDEDLTSSTRHALRLPRAITWDEIVLEAAEAGDLALSAQVKINGVNLFPSAQSLAGAVLHVPRAQWASAFQSGLLAVDAHVTVQLIVSPGDYGSENWSGFAVTFVKS